MDLFRRMNSKLFYKFLFSYLLIFSVPFLCLGFFVYDNAVVNLKNEIEESSVSKLNQIKDIMDMRMEELGHIAAQISMDPVLTPFSVRSDGYSAGLAVDELEKYKANSSIIDEIFLYFHEDPLIYSSAGSIRLDALVSDAYAFGAWDETRLYEELNGVQKPVVHPSERIGYFKQTDNERLAYFYPIKPGSDSYYGTVVYMLKRSVLTDLAGSILGDLKGSVAVFDDDRRSLTTYQQQTQLDASILVPLLATQPLPGISETELIGERYSVMQVTSQRTGWTFMSVIPRKEFMKRVAEVKTFVITVLVTIVLIGLAIAMLFSLKHYRPIREIAEIVMEGPRKSKTERSGNEWARIRQGIESVFDVNRELLQQADENKQMIREQILNQLLKGSIKEEGELQRLLTDHDMLRGKYSFVLFAAMKGSRSLHKEESVLQSLAEMSFDQGEGYAVELVHEHAFAVIVSMDAASAEKTDQNMIADSVLEQYRLAALDLPAIGIGRIYDDPRHINRSFIEACAAAEYRLVHRDGKPIFFDDIHDLQEPTSWYPKEEQIKLVQSLKQGDREVALETLDAILAGIASQEQSILIIKCMCFDLINTVFKTIMDMNLRDYAQNVKELLQFVHLEELKTQLGCLIEEVCEQVHRKRESNNSDLRDQILAYIHDHYKEHMLGLESIADTFGLSVSYLSRFMKEQSGMTFTEYITDLRIGEVKRELRTTHLSVKDIIMQVGYVDVPSFNRKFKKIEGITPGQYRKLHLQQLAE